jgi:hypothetical protein
MIRDPEAFKAAARFVLAAASLFREHDFGSQSVMYSFTGEYFQATKPGSNYKVLGGVPYRIPNKE